MPQEIAGETWLDTQEVSRMLNVQPRVIRKYIKEQRFEAFMIGGKWRMREATIKAYIAKSSNIRGRAAA